MTLSETELLEEIVQGKSKDLFTGLWNKKWMLRFLEQAIEKARVAEKNPICIGWLDVDGMGYLNNELGHRIGDSAILAITKTLTDRFQPLPMVGRVGGDKFMVILNAPLEKARLSLLQVQMEIAARVFSDQTRERKITISIVVSQILKEDTIESCMTRVETGMWQNPKKIELAKRRNDIWIV